MNRNIKAYAVLVLVWFSVSCNESKVETLRVENIRLKQELNALRKQMDSCSFVPSVVTNSNQLSLGEPFLADVKLAVSSREEPPMVVMFEGFSEETGQFSHPYDTLEYNLDIESSVFQFVPTEVGHYDKYGKIIFTWGGSEREVGFLLQFDVD
jgi:hypothetical protein